MNVVSGIATPSLEAAILEDLLELVWIEDLGGVRSKAADAKFDGAPIELRLGTARFVARPELDRWRGGVRLRGVVEAGTGRYVEAPELLWRLLSAMPGLDLSTIDRTMSQVRESARNARDGRAAAVELTDRAYDADGRGEFLTWERLAAWRDRPFHPLAHSRGGWSAGDIRRYGAEFGALFPLSWCAVAAGHVMASPEAGDSDPASAILDSYQLSVIRDELARRGLAKTHLALPLHPWRAERMLAEHFAPERADGRIVLLDFRGPLAAATSSLRTVAIPQRPGLHLKLPLDVETLGVRRLMSAQSLHNGLKGARLLADALALRPGLGARARLADEATFWTFSESSGDVLAARTALIGCALRAFPSSGDDAVLMPLASLAVAPVGGVPPAIGAALELRPGVTAETFLDELFALLVGFAVEALACGFIPEMHGQNVVVEIVAGRPSRLILRDHDTVRCMPERLRKAGLQVPDYIIKDPSRATMLLTREEELCAYAQTLLIDVALRTVCESLDASGCVRLPTSRRLLRAAVERAIGEVQDEGTQAGLRALLLDAETWPFKQILTPLLATGSLGLGMPSALGRANNPLRLDDEAA